MSDIKITSGEFRGRNIKSPNLATTHPMGAREKLALFNMLADFLPGAKVLDAYAGSGALGIEALSRGAQEVLFVEKDFGAMDTIVHNCMMLYIPEEQVAFYRGAVEAFAEKFIQKKGIVLGQRNAMVVSSFPQKVDIILADPPYDDFRPEVLDALVDYLAPGGILALSHPGEAPDIPGLELVKTHKYAAASISIYKA